MAPQVSCSSSSTFFFVLSPEYSSLSLSGFAVFARLVSSFNDLGPPLDRLGRENLETSLEQISQNCLPNIVKLLEAAKWRPKSSSKTSFLETPVGIAAEVLIDTMESQNPNLYKKQEISLCIDVLHRGLKIQAQETDEDEDEGCEVLYGQAGLLYALLRLLDRIDSAAAEVTDDLKLETIVNKTSIVNIVHSIIIRGRFGASVYASNVSSRFKVPSLMWSWHHKRYLGAAHGLGEQTENKVEGLPIERIAYSRYSSYHPHVSDGYNISVYPRYPTDDRLADHMPRRRRKLAFKHKAGVSTIK